MTYNGVPVVYVPADFVNKGLYDSNRVQYYNTAYLNKDIYNYLKPVKLDPATISGVAEPNNFLSKFNAPYEGYIIDEAKWKEFGADNSVIRKPTYSISVAGKPKDNAPIQGITEKDGRLVYAGLRGSPHASGEYSVYDSSGQSSTEGWHRSSGVIKQLSNDIAALGPITLLLNFAVPGLGTAIYAGNQVVQGVNNRNLRQIATATAMLMLPGVDGAPPIIDVPGVSSIVGTISSATGFSAATSGAILQSAINYAVTGGNIGDFLKREFASALGAQAGAFVDNLIGSAGFAGLNTIAKNVASSSTKAFLLNQDVSKAATTAFANTAIPIALNNTPGWDSLSSAQRNAITNGAINAALTGNLDIGGVIKRYTLDVFSDAALKAIPGSDKWTAAQTKLAKDTIAAGVQGKPLDGPLQQYVINQARTAVADQVAKTEGWASDLQKQDALKQYGSKITPDAYSTKQAEKTAAAALNNFEYDYTPEELSQVAAGVKSSANPTEYINQWYDQRTVTPDEIAQFQKDTGVSLTPEQQKSLTGKIDETTVLSDLTKLGQASKQVTEQDTKAKTARDDYLLDQITKAYQEEGYSAELAQRLAQQNLSALAQADQQSIQAKTDYAAYLKSRYGADSEQYRAAAKDVLEAKATAGGYGVVKDQTGAYRTASGAVIDPTSLASTADFTTSALKGAAESALDFLVPPAQAGGQDKLVLTQPKGVATPQDYQSFFSLHASPDPAAAYAQLTPEQQEAYARASQEFQASSEDRRSELLTEFRRGTLGGQAPSEQDILGGQVPSEQDILERLQEQAAEQDAIGAALGRIREQAQSTYISAPNFVSPPPQAPRFIPPTPSPASRPPAAPARQQPSTGSPSFSANDFTLAALLEALGGQQQPQQPPTPAPLTDIKYVYDIGGPSIFATPQQEQAFVTPYAENGSVQDLMNILRGTS